MNSLIYDICVVGSGPGGFSAAISAKKAAPNARVLIVDRSGHLGGMAASGIPFLGFLDRQRRKIVGGFSDGLIDRLVAIGASRGVRFDPKHLSVSVVKPDLLKIAIADWCDELGIDILLHSELCGAETANGLMRAATFVCSGNFTRVEAKTFIDATGDGTLGFLAGAAYEKGRGPEGKVQPPTVIYTIQNVDKPRFIDYLEHSDRASLTAEYMREDDNYCVVCLNSLWHQLSPRGEWPIQIWAFICVNSLNDGEVFVNGPRMPKTDPTDAASVTKAELLGQKQAFSFTEMLRRYVPGFERCHISHVNDHIGVRETRRLMGLKKLVVNEAKESIIPSDSIALAGYPIDIHSSDDNTSVMVPLDKPFGIPYGCLVSRTFPNLLLSGRCISVDPDVFGSTRVMATCFAIGEAAGIAAALSYEQNCLPNEISVDEVRAKLHENGAILDEADITETL